MRGSDYCHGCTRFKNKNLYNDITSYRTTFVRTMYSVAQQLEEIRSYKQTKLPYKMFL